MWTSHCPAIGERSRAGRPRPHRAGWSAVSGAVSQGQRAGSHGRLGRGFRPADRCPLRARGARRTGPVCAEWGTGPRRGGKACAETKWRRASAVQNGGREGRGGGRRCPGQAGRGRCGCACALGTKGPVPGVSPGVGGTDPAAGSTGARSRCCSPALGLSLAEP